MMRFFKSPLFFVLSAIAALFCLLHAVIFFNGKAILINKLHNIFGREVSVKSIRSTFPLNVIIKDIDVKGLFHIKKVTAEGGVVDLFRRGFILSSLELTGVNARVDRSLQGAASQVMPLLRKVASSSGNRQLAPDNFVAVKIFYPFLSIRHLRLQDGTFIFADKEASDKGIIVTVKYLNAAIDNLNIPIQESVITSFDLKAAIPWQEGQEEGRIKIQGWIDAYRRNMEASVSISAIDGVYLYPYYSRWLNLEKARIQKAKLNFSSDIRGLNNDVSAACHLELTDIVFKPRPIEEDPLRDEKIATAVVGMFKNLDQGNMALDFTFKTKMNDPALGMGAIKEAIQDKINQSRKATAVQEAAQIPGKLLEGVFKGAKDLTTAVMVGTIGAGKQVGRALGIPFKKEKGE